MRNVRTAALSSAMTLAIIVGGGQALAVNWDNGIGDFLWSTGGNWQENSQNGPGGVVPMNENIFINFGPIIVNSVVPSVNDVFVANNVPPPDPEDPNAATNQTVLTVESDGVLVMANGQLKVGAFTGIDSPPMGVTATLTIKGNGVVDSRYGVVTNPLFHPEFGNISSFINIQDDGVLNAGTGLFLGGGDTTINVSGNGEFNIPNGFFEHVEGGNSVFYDPLFVGNPYGINAVINLSGNGRIVVPNTGTFAVDEIVAEDYIANGLFQAAGGVTHFVEGDNRVFKAVAPEVLPGDYNGDFVVDAADYTVWRNHLGEPTEAAINYAGNGSNGVDPLDYDHWKTHFGTQAGSGAVGGRVTTSVPEPTTAVLLLISVLALGGSRRPQP